MLEKPITTTKNKLKGLDMYEQIEKPKENKDRVVANFVTQKKRGGQQGFGFVDKRLEVVAQRKHQEMVNISPQAINNMELQTAQLKNTNIKHTTGTINAMGADRVVGKKMEAELNPKEPVVGSATGVNSDWMKWIRNQYPNANVVRGHLLNHDLGGFAIEENLYPISTLANADHSAKVEQNVKGALSWADQVADRWVEYNVTVNEKDSYQDSQFVCNWKAYNSDNSVFKSDRQTIDSNLGIDKGGFGGGKKEQQSPAAWRHGKNKGGTEVKAIRARLDKAIGDGKVAFQSESSITDHGGSSDFSPQDAVELLFDMVETYGISATWSALVNIYAETAEEDKKAFFKKLIDILESEPVENWD